MNNKAWKSTNAVDADIKQTNDEIRALVGEMLTFVESVADRPDFCLHTA